MPRHYNDAISHNDLDGQRERDEWDQIENVVGLTEDSITTLAQAPCNDCGDTHQRDQMWYVPEGSRAICKRCRDLRVAGQRFIR